MGTQGELSDEYQHERFFDGFQKSFASFCFDRMQPQHGRVKFNEKVSSLETIAILAWVNLPCMVS